MHGGLDWSGTTYRNSENPLYVPCVVAVYDAEKLSALFADLRRNFGMKQDEEFRGSKSSGEKLAAVLNVGLQLEFGVGVLLIDKTQSLVLPPTKADFVTLSAQRLLNRFMQCQHLHRLWCDDEDLGKAEERRFKSDIAQIARGCGVEKIKTSIYPSHKSDLIQLADMTAYAFSWDARKRSEIAVKIALQKICKNANNIIVGPMGWEE